MRLETNQKRKRKLRLKKKWKALLFLLLLLFLGATVYSYVQYKQGLLVSGDKANNEKVKYQFNGKRDQFGGTNILLIGSDAREKESSRADTIMIVRYHPDKKTFKLLSIMRDSYVDIPGHGKNKINAAFAFGGPELLRQTIKENFDLELQYYTIIDFQGFVHVIDEAFPKGVEIDVEKRMDEYINVALDPGVQRLDGESLLGYVRFRHDAIGDFGRVQRQQKVVKELAEQFSSIATIPKLPKLIGVVTPFVNTNLSTANMISMGTDYMMKKEAIKTIRIPIDGAFEGERVSGVGSVLSLDFEENKQGIYNFLKE